MLGLEQRLIGQSSSFLATVAQVSRVAPLDKPVLIVGERGTGKELFAARLHFLSRRWQGPYLQMNCAVLSEGLLESELFGHEAGAFTGALRRHAGRFERAESGTLFLDEIASTSARVQEQLLRVVEYGQYERLGGREALRADVRLVAATNEDLPTLATSGRFRHDLLDRLSFDVITLPPLRQREHDILLLAEHFANTMTRELERPLFPGFAVRAREQLLAHPWPGNVRELKNAVERSLYRHEDWERTVSEIVIDPFESPFRPLGATVPVDQMPPVAKEGAREPSFRFPLNARELLGGQETAMIVAAMQEARFNQRRAAALLGLGYHQLRAAMRRLGVDGKGRQAGDAD